MMDLIVNLICIVLLVINCVVVYKKTNKDKIKTILAVLLTLMIEIVILFNVCRIGILPTTTEHFEIMLYKLTGVSFDINNDGITGYTEYTLRVGEYNEKVGPLLHEVEIPDDVIPENFD